MTDQPYTGKRAPSMERLAKAFPSAPKRYLEAVRGLINGTMTPLQVIDQAGLAKVVPSYMPVDGVETRLLVMNWLLDTHGVEAIFDSKTSTMAPWLCYLNTGQTYTTTLVYRPGSGAFALQSWGDAVENFERHHHPLSN